MTPTLRIPPRRVFLVFGGFSVLFAALGLTAVVWHFRVLDARGSDPEGWVRLVDVNQEANLPTWFAVFGLVCSSAACALAAAARRSLGEPFAGHWTFLAALFLFLSIDEAVGVHEAISPAVHDSLETEGVLRFAWVIPYGAAVLVIGLVFLRFLGHLHPRLRRGLALAAVLYVGGAIGLELAQGWWTSHYGWGFGLGLLTVIEEGAEMLGVAVFLTTVTAYLADVGGEVALVFGPSRMRATIKGRGEGVQGGDGARR